MKIKNVNPLGEVEDLLLGRVVGAGEVVEVTKDQAVARLATGNYKPADKAAKDLAEETSSPEPADTEEI